MEKKGLAVTQNIGGIEKFGLDIANNVLTELRNGNPQQAKELIFPPPLPVEQGRYVDALDLVFPSGYNP